MSQQCDRDLACLNALLEDDQADGLPPAFEDMLSRLEKRPGSVLSPKQRRYVNGFARRLGLEPSEGPEDEELAEPPIARLTSGAVPRGNEVAPAWSDKPLRPPARKS